MGSSKFQGFLVVLQPVVDHMIQENKIGTCPFCKLPVYKEDFRDALSKREFGISGLCQTCQDSTFGIGG